MKDLKLGYAFHKPRINTPQPTPPNQPNQPMQPKQPTQPTPPIRPTEEPANLERQRSVLPPKRDDFLITRMLEERKKRNEENHEHKLEDIHHLDATDNVFVTLTKKRPESMLTDSSMNDRENQDIKMSKPERMISSTPI